MELLYIAYQPDEVTKKDMYISPVWLVCYAHVFHVYLYTFQ